MAEAAQPKYESGGEGRSAGAKRLQPWVDAGKTLPEWLASLEDDPPPGEDSIPMIEPHAEAMCYSRDAFTHHFHKRSAGAGKAVHVGFDLPIVFHLKDEHGRARAGRLSPDVLVGLAVGHLAGRREYDADALGPPDFVLEVMSRSTWQRDVDAKLKTYAAIGVRECFLFDPTGEFPVDELQGFALSKTRVRRLPFTTLANGAEGVRSRVLGLAAHVGEQRMPPGEPGAAWALSIRWHDPETGEDLPTYLESLERAEAAGSRVVELEAQIARLEGR